MKVVWTFVKHEILKVVKNKKMLFSIFVMPILLVAFSLGLTTMQMEGEAHADTYRLCFFNAGVQEESQKMSGVVLQLENGSEEEYAEFLKDKQVELDEIFVEFVESGVNVYYNSLDGAVEALLPNIEGYIIQPYMEAIYAAGQGVAVEHFALEVVDTSDEMERQNLSLSFMLPYLLQIILFMNLVSVVGDTFAGEKERGILAKQVLTPVSTNQLIYGKLIGSTLIGVSSSVIYFVVLAIGDLIALEVTGKAAMGIVGASLELGQVVVMLVGFTFLSLVFVAAIVLASCFAKTVKEATNLSMIVYYIVIVAAVASAFQMGEAPLVSYAIPIYNFSLFMSNVLVGTATVVNGLVTAASLLVTFFVLVAASVFSFSGEKAIN
ncbi:MAG: ABC transporter permease [Agathobacter sp.]|nr:ABC transporter permease [Agathobacter sp.]